MSIAEKEMRNTTHTHTHTELILKLIFFKAHRERVTFPSAVGDEMENILTFMQPYLWVWRRGLTER